AEGTIWKRLSRARKLLQRRLTRRGVSLTAVLAAAGVVGDGASAAVPRCLLGPTVKAAAQMIAGRSLAGGPVSARGLSLVDGVNRAMFVSKCKTALLLLVSTFVVGTGIGLAALQGAGAEPGPTPPQAAPKAPGEGPKVQRPQPADRQARAPDKDPVQMSGR